MPATIPEELARLLDESEERVRKLREGVEWILWTAEGGRGSSTPPKTEIARKARALLKDSL